MSFFSKKYDLKKVWQDIKKDAEKARGGKKPGGKMGFEDLLDKLEKAVQSKTPDANAIMRQTADLAAKMKAYAASLPDGEHEFVADINGFVNILTEIARACEINARQIAAEHKELLLARNKIARINQIGDALQMRLNKLRARHAALVDAKAAAALLKEINALDEAIQKVGADMGEATAEVMRLQD